MEAGFISWLQGQLQSPDALGLTDDAARLVAPDSVITTDLLLEGVHFEAGTDLRRVGHKALAVNLSDLAAMAATPQAALCSLALPMEDANSVGRQLMEGMAPLAKQYEMAIIGGDTNVWRGPLAINLAVWGEPRHGMLRRDGGRVGDRLLVTGALGGSLLSRHLDFQPRVHEAIALQARFGLHAGMDITDGLVLDLSRMATASGCGAIIDREKIPIAAAAEQMASTTGRTGLDHALHDGEDFELLLALTPQECARLLSWAKDPDALQGLSVSEVGELCPAPGVFARETDGSLTLLPIRGYLHGDAER